MDKDIVVDPRHKNAASLHLDRFGLNGLNRDHLAESFAAYEKWLRVSNHHFESSLRQPSNGEIAPHSRQAEANSGCWAKALPDEPMFIILGRDPDGANIVRLWARRRSAAGDPAHGDPVLEVADAMDAWRAAGHRPASAPEPSAYPPLAQPSTDATVEDEACTSCDDTGDIIAIDGEWRGYCNCPAGITLQSPSPRADADRDDGKMPPPPSLPISPEERARLITEYTTKLKDEYATHRRADAADARVRELEKELNLQREMNEVHASLADDHCQRALAAEAERDKLREALKPFAKEADAWGELVPDDHAPLCVEMGHTNGAYYGSSAEYTVGDLRIARQALASITAEKSSENGRV